MPGTNPPQGRWSYSLRTIFIVMTALGIILAYAVNWIHKRHKILEQRGSSNVAGVKAPLLLRPFAEPGYAEVFIVLESADRNRRITPEEQRALAEIARQFPEARTIGAFSSDGLPYIVKVRWP